MYFICVQIYVFEVVFQIVCYAMQWLKRFIALFSNTINYPSVHRRYSEVKSIDNCRWLFLSSFQWKISNKTVREKVGSGFACFRSFLMVAKKSLLKETYFV